MLPPVAVNGRVIDADELPVDDAKVTLETSEHNALGTSFTQRGTFTFSNIKPQLALIRAEKGGVTSNASIDLKQNWRDSITLKLNMRRPSPIKRVFFVLKGHAADILVRDKKLPGELETKLGGSITLVNTPVLEELNSLLRKFSSRIREPAELWSDKIILGTDDRESERREAALKKIEDVQLKRLGKSNVLGAFGGNSVPINMAIDAMSLPPAFFSGAPWFVGAREIGDSVQEAESTRISGNRLDVPLQSMSLLKFATKADLALWPSRHTNNEKIDLASSNQTLRFYDFVSRNGMPANFILLHAYFDECAESAIVSVVLPPLQLRVVVLENVTDKAVELGDFHFRQFTPAAEERLIRTQKENSSAIAGATPASAPWYLPRMLSPGEKIVVPLELVFNLADSRLMEDITGPEEFEKPGSSAARHYVQMLDAHKNVETVAIVYERRSDDGSKKTRETLFTLPRQKFVEALSGERPQVIRTDSFVYGSSIALEGIDVDGFRHPIEPSNPAYVSYFSGYEEGSCPYVYCQRSTDHKWVKQGAILRGLRSKDREGTRELELYDFDGTLKISEEEEEVSYIDQLFVRGDSPAGQITLKPNEKWGARKVGHYLVLRKGDFLDITFPVSRSKLDHVRLVASGFFIPTKSALQSNPPLSSSAPFWFSGKRYRNSEAFPPGR
jgi:hypothetical protein